MRRLLIILLLLLACPALAVADPVVITLPVSFLATWDDPAVAYTGLSVDITDTASQWPSRAFVVNKNGWPAFYVGMDNDRTSLTYVEQNLVMGYHGAFTWEWATNVGGSVGGSLILYHYGDPSNAWVFDPSSPNPIWGPVYALRPGGDFRGDLGTPTFRVNALYASTAHLAYNIFMLQHFSDPADHWEVAGDASSGFVLNFVAASGQSVPRLRLQADGSLVVPGLAGTPGPVCVDAAGRLGRC